MLQELEKILGEELRYLAIATRDRLDLTQKEMGEQLEMGTGSYSDVETGETICISVLSLRIAGGSPCLPCSGAAENCQAT